MDSEKVSFEVMLQKAKASTNWEGHVAVNRDDNVHVLPSMYARRCGAEIVFYVNCHMCLVVSVDDWEKVRDSLEVGGFNQVTVFDEMVGGEETNKMYFCN